MKKFGLTFIILYNIILFSQVAIAPNVGDGSETTPYEINSLQNLYWITASNNVVPTPNRDVRWSSHYVQTANIDASETTGWFLGEGWLPIGIWVSEGNEENFPFSGKYDGLNYTIDSIYINRPSSHNVGLFGYIENSVLENIATTNAEIIGYRRVGGIVGHLSNSYLLNCYSSGSIHGLQNIVGGISGQNWEDNFIELCSSDADVSGVDFIGGLVGNAYFSDITSCNSTGWVTGSNYIGGLIVSYQ